MGNNDKEAYIKDNQKVILWVEEYQATKDENIKKELINFVFLAYQAYLKSIVRSFARRSNDPFDDLFQVASVGIIKTMQTFDKNVNENFKTYATQIIVGEIRHYLRDKAAIIRAPRSMRELSFRIHKIANELTEKTGKEPSNEEIAQQLKISDKKIREAKNLERRTTPVSIEQLNLVTDSYLQDTMNKNALEEYEKTLSNFDTHLVLKDAISKLDKETQNIICMNFFEELNYSQIAQRLDTNPMAISRIIRKALNKLFLIITNKGNEKYDR